MLGTGIAITRWRGGASSNGAQSLLSGETDGLALSFLDASAQIKDTTTPANVYNSAGRVSAGALVGPGGKLTYTAPSLKLTRQSNGVYTYQAHNLYLNSAAPANQSITVVSGATYAITITGSVSVTASGAATGTWTAGTTEFTAATATLTLGSTSGSGTVHVRRTPSADTYIATTSAAKYDLPYEWDSAGSALGILVEEARTNLLLNSGIGVTQNVTTSATAYTLSFFGTGTVTLSGTSTDGPLVGTGASDRVSMTFTPTAGTLTLTVSGSCTRCQIEAGSFATSPIETFGSTVTRAADNITLATTTFPWSATAGAVFGVYTVKVLNHAFVSLFANANENIEMFCDVNNHLRVVTGGVVQAAVDAGIVTVNTTARHAGAWAVNDFAAIIDGGTVGTDAAGNLPSAISTLGIGRRASASQQMNGYVKSLMYVPRRMADAELQTLTTP